MTNILKFKISILKLLLITKLNNYYKKIERIIGIRLKNSTYFTYKLVKMLFTLTILLAFCRTFYDDKYNNSIIVIYTLLLIISNLSFIFNGSKNIVEPYNIELFQISYLKQENLSYIFLATEYMWLKLKELDTMLPIFFITIYLYGNLAILYTILIESILFLLTIFITNIIKSKEKRTFKTVPKRHLFKYLIISSSIVILMIKFTGMLVKLSKMCRKHLNSLDSLNKDNLEKIEIEVLRIFSGLFNKIEIISRVDIISKLNSDILLILILTILISIYCILKYKKIDYSIQNYKFQNNSSELKRKYINLMRLINKKTFNSFLVSKDLDIIENLVDVLKKDFFSTVVLPYDYFVIITLASVVISNVTNEYLVVLFIIFSTVSLIFNQVNTLTNIINEIFKFKQDMYNVELYKISKYNVKDLLESKIQLCLCMTLFPFIVYILSSIIILLVKLGPTIELLISLFILFIIDLSIYLFAPKINMYIYAYIMSLSNSNSDIIERYKDDDEDNLVHKFCEFPKKLIILPLMYFLLFNSVIRLIDNPTWKYVLVLYIFLIVFLIIIENKFVNKILKWGDTG